MANHRKKQVGKRKSKGWRKKSPKCTLCTYFRWMGNAKGRKRFSYYRQQKVTDSSEDYYSVWGPGVSFRRHALNHQW